MTSVTPGPVRITDKLMTGGTARRPNADGTMRPMGDQTTVSARRFETYVRWSTYTLATAPILSLAGGALADDRVVAEHDAAFAGAAVLALVLVAGNILISRWSIGILVRRPRRVSPAAVVVWMLALAGLVAVTLLAIPVQVMGLTAAVAAGSVAASLVLVFDARRTFYLNVAVVVVAALVATFADLTLLVTGVLLISLALWSYWSSGWLLRVLRELQEAHEDRAALALANERLRISRDLHDVFGRTLATIAVKSELASELVRRGGGERAAEELTAVRRLAQEAGSEVRRVVRGEVRVTWDGEVSGARSLLGSAGIGCTVAGDPVPDGHAEALGWVVREGVTNVLRHSAATQVTFATTTEDGQVLLTIANDGAGRAGSAAVAAAGAAGAAGADGPGATRPDGGTGLRAMSDRIRALGGRITTSRDGDWFLLEATIPLPEGSAA
ncbi:sensor histidine kinase [Promicromonospora sp. NPDC057138]|uniref:sensor histidine kinase n=1 Tax=Promicromonospora sp. NPDC057138 TaxID=3346031 RepID=UPI0036394376